MSILGHRRSLRAALPLALVLGAATLLVPLDDQPATAHTAESAMRVDEVRTVGVVPGESVLFPGKVPARKVRKHKGQRASELGVAFRVRKPGSLTGVRVYKVARGAGRTPVTASLWSSDGTLVASGNFEKSRGAGWVTVRFAQPVTAAKGNVFTASVHAPDGRYAVTPRWFRKPRVTPELRTIRGASGVRRVGARSKMPTRVHASANYWVDPIFRPDAPVLGPTATPTSGPTPLPPSSFPNETNTGVPAGTVLTAYTGPMRITTDGTVIDAKQINGTLEIAARDVTLTRSSVAGSVSVSSGNLHVTDTLIDVGDQPGTGLESSNYVAERVHIMGGNRSAYCAMNCTIQDSYVHGQMTDETGYYHESGIRMEQRTTLIGNTIACDAPTIPPDAGCSAGLTGYGDFAPVRDNLVQGNLFLPTTGGACAYGGSSGGKPFSSGAGNIRFIDNVFSRGKNRKCGEYFPVTDFDASAPGNLWQGNVWDDGKAVKP